MRLKIGLFLLVFGLLAACNQQTGFRNTDVTDAGLGRDFTLTAHNGERIDTRKLRGKVLMIFFGYTHCPDICTPTLAKLDHVTRRLGARAHYTQVLFVSVDPERDTPQRLAAFLKKFHPSFLGLTGKPAAIKSIADAYKVVYMQKAKPGKGKVEFSHSGAIFIIDRQGRLRAIASQSSPLSHIEHDVRVLIRGY